MSLFDVLGSKARLKILRELVSEPRYVSELAENVGMDGKTAVHHLSTLEEAGVVESYRTSQRKYYRLTKRIELRAAPEPDSLFLLHADDIDADDAATNGVDTNGDVDDVDTEDSDTLDVDGAATNDAATDEGETTDADPASGVPDIDGPSDRM